MDNQIAMLWMRGSLSFLEQLCVKSFVDAGHHVALYAYDEIGRVPDGVEMRDANDILPEDGFLVHERTGSPALHSDVFRYKLLAANDRTIWADTDAYCHQPFRTFEGHLHGWESAWDINGGVLALPRDSETLAALLEFTSDEYAIPPFHETKYRGGRGAAIREALDSGRPIHVGDQPWGVWGPHAVTHFLQVTGEVRYTRPGIVLYPYSFKERRRMLRPLASLAETRLTEETMSVHFYGRRMRERLAKGSDGFPDPDSLIGHFLLKHQIDPLEAPLRENPNPDPDHPFAKVYRDAARGGAQYTAAPVPTAAPAEKHRPLDKVTAVTTMRNEGPYILDWVAYHLGVGITHFLVYTNDCDDQTNAILDRLSDLGVVTRVDNPVVEGQRPQRVALEMAQTHPAVTQADAYVVMDVDEYINIHVGEGRLTDLFAASGDPDLLSMTWRFFGCNDVVSFEDKPVAAQFTRAAPLNVRKPHQNWGFKTFVRTGAPFGKIGVHRPLDPTGPMPRWTNGSGRQMPDKYRDGGWRSNRNTWGYDLVTLNHYAIRSIDGFLVKRDRGRTNHVNRDQGIEYWNTHNRNDEEDRSILRRLHLMDEANARFLADEKLPELHMAACNWHRNRARLLAKAPENVAFLNQVAPEAQKSSGAPETAGGADSLAGFVPSTETATPSETSLIPSGEPKAVGQTPAGDPIYLGRDNEAAFSALLNRVAPRFPPLTSDGVKRSHGKTVIVTSMKNEGAFILEWVAYHLAIGIDHFLVYTNDCSDPTNDILDRLELLGYVTRRDNPFDRAAGQKPQRGALNAAWTEPVVREADWVGVIDVDEFVNIHVGDGTFSALIDAMHQPNVVSMTWRFFGSRGVDRFEDRWMTKQFLRCAPRYLPRPRLGWGFKSFFHKDAPVGKLGVHRPLDLDVERMDDLRWVNGSGRIMPDHSIQNATWFSRKNSIGYDMVTLNHYILRSAESFLVKRDRGRINHVDQDQGLSYWKRRNYTTELDDSILMRLGPAESVWADLMQDADLKRLHEQAVTWHISRIVALQANDDYARLYRAITDPALDDALFVFEDGQSTDEVSESQTQHASQHAAE